MYSYVFQFSNKTQAANEIFFKKLDPFRAYCPKYTSRILNQAMSAYIAGDF